MTVSFKNGLDYDDLMKIAHALNPVVFEPETHAELNDGVNALVALISFVRNVPLLSTFLPGNIGGQIDKGVKALQLLKGLLEA